MSEKQGPEDPECVDRGMAGFVTGFVVLNLANN